MNTRVDDAAELFDETPAILAPDEKPREEPKYKRSLDHWKKRFTDFQNVTQENRKQQERHYDYYDGIQLTATERAELKGRGQPDVIINRFRVAINGIIGVNDHSRADPRALGRTPKDSNSADVATDCLRYVGEVNRFKFEEKYLLKDNLLGGTCAMLIGLGAEKGDIDMRSIRWEEFFYDPRSKRPDFRDCRYMGIATWMYSDEVVDLAPEDTYHAAQVQNAFEAGGLTGRSGNGADDTFDDRPNDMGWLDHADKRIQVVEIYEKIDGNWYQCVFWEGGIITESLSPYLDDKGKPCNPIEAQACYVDRKNNRIGYAVDLIDIQDEINKRRSKALWEISSNQIQASDPSAIEVNSEEARKEASRPDGVLPFGWQKVAGTDKTAGNMALLSEAKNEMERFSPNPAMLGRQGADTSGRAMLARQQAGLIELSVVLDQFEDFKLRCWKQVWARAKQDWTDPMWIRLTDDMEDPKFVGLNQPILEAPQLDEAGQPVLDEAGQPVMVQLGDGQEFGYDNQIAEMDIDVMIDTVPETATIMAEQLTELRSMVASNPAYAQEVPFEIFLEMTNMPRKRELMKKIAAHKKAQQEAAQKNAEEEKAAMMAELDAKIKEMLSKAMLNQALATAADAGIENDRIRTATNADKTLAAIDAEATRVSMEGAKTTNEILSTPKPADPAAEGQSGETDAD